MEPETPAGDVQPKTPSRSRIWRWILILAAVAVILGAVIYQSITFLSQPPVRRGRFSDAGGPQSVGVKTIQRGDIRLIVNALGAVTPLTTVTVNTQISGLLMEVGFKEGQLVHKGQFLAQIDPRPYQVALEEDQAQLARDEATLKQAEMDLERYKRLADQTSIARQTYEDQVWVVKQNQGTVDYDKAQIKAQELNLVYCHIVAPSDGRVGLRLVDPGNFVQTTSSTGIVVLTLLNPISVVFSVPEDSIPQIMARVHAGAKLQITAFDRANVKQLAVGEFAAIDNEVDTTTGTVRLRANFDNAAETLFPSQFVNVVMALDTLKDVVTVPVAAVQRGAPGTYVYLLAEDNTVSVHPISLGAQDGDFFAVESGLSPGDRVVTEGADRLRDGAHVTVPPQPGAAPSGAPGTAPPGRHRRSGQGQDASGKSPGGASQGPGGAGQGPGGAGQGPGGAGQGPAGASPGVGQGPGATDADAAARRERWRQRHPQQDEQTPPGNPQAPSDKQPAPSGKPPAASGPSGL
ncbi:MAG: efflux RND transporter periplasmic adaptor subunit [Steroidobacteraceae bacterium]|jgi:multidrug efflux system membrane fusion protein